MNEEQHAKSLYQKPAQLKRMLDMVQGMIDLQTAPDPVAEKVKFDLQTQILMLKLELNTRYYQD